MCLCISDKTLSLVGEDSLDKNIVHELLLFLKQVNLVLSTHGVTFWVKDLAETLCHCFRLEFMMASIPELRFVWLWESRSILMNSLSECANIIRSFVRVCIL